MATAERSWSRPGLIGGAGDVARVLAEVNAAGLRRDRTAAMAQAVGSAADSAVGSGDASRLQPVVPAIGDLLPWAGLRRGATVGVLGSTSLLMTLLAPPIAAGAWAAVVGLPEFGALAAGNDFGIDLARLALVPAPGPDWPTVVAALMDGFDVVAVATAVAPAEAVARSLTARARQRGCVLLTVKTAWPGADLSIEVVERQWTGLGVGRGRLRQQQLTLRATGRGSAARPRTGTLTLGVESRVSIPAPEEAVPAVTAVPTPATPPPEPVWPPARPGRHAVEPPVDPWAALVHRLPPPAPRRRRADRNGAATPPSDGRDEAARRERPESWRLPGA
ncbi:hypothetical protein [Nucisporomicrobium flavum]|uniref:hypothetical protein n=1 Tax=Nucisporomicrobium flavum TaxID=2785915 RepID=UPI001F2A42A1|nr:hypothetical protein [Nucisporomicrobium flavum]